jgi:CRISPR/Cas system-associated exonuclease Cas4 (RecB family)
MAYSKSTYKAKTYQPGQKAAFRVSRSKIDLFLECPRCFYLNCRLGVSRPSFPPFNLNLAVDVLFKKEFDIHRNAQSTHPLMKTYGIDAVPFQHTNLEVWRENFKGLTVEHKESGLLVAGAIDDIWVNPAGELIVVDYKATSKDEAVNLDAEWQIGYKRQMEVYQWLLASNGFPVSKTGYFVYANGKKDRAAFDGKLEFEVTVIPYTGDFSWVEKTLPKIKACLDDARVPNASADCEFCSYRQEAGEAIKKAMVAAGQVTK